MWFFYLFVAALIFRMWTLSVSVRHERVLKAAGGVEYGRRNSLVLAGMHTLFYLAAIGEASLRKPAFDLQAIAGIVLYFGGALVLLLVMGALGRLWTVKLILARDHVLSTHWIFRVVRHPNYLLAIVPELLGLSLFLHAFYTSAIVGGLYILPLVQRIREESSIMKTAFASY